MGFFSFFFFLFFSRAFLKKKSSQFANAAKVSTHYDIYQPEKVVKKLNLFKRSSSVARNLKKIRTRRGLNFLSLDFSVEKIFFFYINLALAFLRVSELRLFLSFYFVKKIKEERLLWIVLQCVLIACVNFLVSAQCSFQHFSKVSDFFFFRKNALFHGAMLVLPQFSSSAVVTSSLVRVGFRRFFKKVKQANQLELDKLGLVFASTLLLVNAFFSKKKKFFFLRNNEIYNKSRYSRNRQTYKTGVFWCI